MTDDLASVAFILAALKRERVPFADAWAIAVPASLPHRDRAALRVALDETAEAWERAYVGAPPTAGERAAARIAALLSAGDDAEDRGALVASRCG